jgi:AcrR family transcriptional regulator
MGFSKAETVKALTEKLEVSKQAVYYHFNCRGKWQSNFIALKDSQRLLEVRMSRLNYIYREASFQYLHADNSNAKVGFLRVMLAVALEAPEISESQQGLGNKIIVEVRVHPTGTD